VIREPRSSLISTRDYPIDLHLQAANIRQVDPYHLICVESHWYLFAFDLRREPIRTFVLISAELHRRYGGAETETENHDTAERLL
jgi:hypothetical protein